MEKHSTQTNTTFSIVAACSGKIKNTQPCTFLESSHYPAIKRNNKYKSWILFYTADQKTFREEMANWFQVVLNYNLFNAMRNMWERETKGCNWYHSVAYDLLEIWWGGNEPMSTKGGTIYFFLIGVDISSKTTCSILIAGNAPLGLPRVKWFALLHIFIFKNTQKKTGVATTFIQRLLVNFINSYRVSLVTQRIKHFEVERLK